MYVGPWQEYQLAKLKAEAMKQLRENMVLDAEGNVELSEEQ